MYSKVKKFNCFETEIILSAAVSKIHKRILKTQLFSQHGQEALKHSKKGLIRASKIPQQLGLLLE